MKGTVKFYNSEKGFGFIYTNESSNDIYFSINDWKNPSVPNGNDDVEFQTVNDKKGLKAINISITRSAEAKGEEKKKSYNSNDDRINCPNCNKKIVPRMITYKGEPEKSVCPYCATTIQKFSNCFIATAVYNDSYHPNVVLLRRFRNEYLLTNKIGNDFVNMYYKYSPKFALFIKDKKVISFPIKIILDIFVFLFRHFYTNAKR